MLTTSEPLQAALQAIWEQHECTSISHTINRGRIVFTARSRKAAEELTQSSGLELSDMGKTEAGQLLVPRRLKPALLDDEKAVYELPESYLPLGLVQAAAFVNDNEISVSGYISLF
jgi:hypothetical protein